MLNTKLFPDFTGPGDPADPDALLFRKMCNLRDQAGAIRINLHIFDFDYAMPNVRNYLTCPLSWIGHYIVCSYMDCDPFLKTDFRKKDVWDWWDLDWSGKAVRLLDDMATHNIGQNGLMISQRLSDDKYGVVSLHFDMGDDEWTLKKKFIEQKTLLPAQSIFRIYEMQEQLVDEESYSITRREAECLQLVALGRTDRQIANVFGISRFTVSDHMKKIRSKLGTSNRAASVAVAMSAGLISI